MSDTSEDLLALRLFEAYYKARKNKRNTMNQLKFEMDYEHNLLQLAAEISERRYKPRPCIAFIINNPVKREIFAADFRDRVVHHLLYEGIYHIVDKKLIHDTYSCRVGKGTLYGINRMNAFIRSCTKNYQQDAYILKLDISGYFRNIQHDVLWEKTRKILSGRNNEYGGLPRELIDYLLRRIIYTHAADNCIIKCSKAEWKGLPNTKSLFHTRSDCGLPIGNLTSQVFGNIFLNDLDQFVKHKLKLRYYGRYVDDMVFIHHSKEYLREVVGTVREELATVGLDVHPGKIYLQHYTKGVLFLGQFIKPFRKYISRRTKNNFFKLIEEINSRLDTEKRLTDEVISRIQARMNSYLGILGQANTYHLIRKARKRLCPQFFFFFSFNRSHSKVTPNLRNLLWHYTQPCLPIKSLMIC